MRSRAASAELISAAERAATIEVEEAVSLDLRNPGELVLESVGGAQRGEAQGIRRFEHEERLLALGKQALELERGARDGIAGHDQTLDRRIIGHAQGAVDSRRGEDQEYARDPALAHRSTRRKI